MEPVSIEVRGRERRDRGRRGREMESNKAG